MPFGMKKTRMVWLPDGEKILMLFIRFHTIHERDMTHKPRLCIALRGKKWNHSAM